MFDQFIITTFISTLAVAVSDTGRSSGRIAAMERLGLVKVVGTRQLEERKVDRKLEV
jgi:hypothetical protein